MHLKKIFQARGIHRIYVGQTLRSVALSFIGIYIPIYLLTNGYSLVETILFFAIYHGFGLLFVLSVGTRLMEHIGLVRTMKLYYPLEIVFFLMLLALPTGYIPLWIVALVGGAANNIYWTPLNILLIRHADFTRMGRDLSMFFALPKIFGILGPLVSAALIPFVGFLPMFVVAVVGLIISYIPLIGISLSEVTISLRARDLWRTACRKKYLLVLEAFDNILEEAEWFWGIFVFLIIGSLSAPGIVGAMEAFGGAAFTLLVGKYADKDNKKLIYISMVLVIGVWMTRFFIDAPLYAYTITVAASFVMTMFLVSYFSYIYRATQRDQATEFIVVREIPTVIGRLILFGVIILVASDLRMVFYLPIVAAIVLFALLRRADRLPKGSLMSSNTAST